MMKNWPGKLEVLANIAIVVVALLIGIVLIKKYLLNDHPAPPPEIVAGTHVSLSGVDWAKNDQTLLLILQKGCHFCSESAPFYQRLVKETAGRGNVHLVAVLPQEVGEGKDYLNQIQVPIEDVKQAQPGSLGARGTPTLILVNRAGAVVDSWVGKLSTDEESKVLRRLQGNAVASR